MALQDRKIKYMGSSDIVTIFVGDTFNGRLPGGLPETVIWSWDNHHVISTKEHGLTVAMIDLILSEKTDNGDGVEVPRFQDVTENELVPTNRAEQLWMGLTDPEISTEDREAAGVPVQPLGTVNPSGVGGLHTGSGAVGTGLIGGGDAGTAGDTGGSGNDAGAGSAAGTSSVGGSGNDA